MNNNKDNYDLSSEDEFLIKLSLLLHKLPNEIEEEMPIMYYDMYRKYLNKYGDPNNQMITQIAQLTHALVCCHGNKTLKLTDFLPYEYRKISEDAYWKNIYETKGYTKEEFDLANKFIMDTHLGFNFRKGKEKVEAIVDKVYGPNNKMLIDNEVEDKKYREAMKTKKAKMIKNKSNKEITKKSK